MGAHEPQSIEPLLAGLSDSVARADGEILRLSAFRSSSRSVGL